MRLHRWQHTVQPAECDRAASPNQVHTEIRQAKLFVLHLQVCSRVMLGCLAACVQRRSTGLHYNDLVLV
jgi:hypothetical protein